MVGGEERKDELLAELAGFAADEVEDVLARLSEAIGDGHARDVDVEAHVLDVTRTVMHGQARHELERGLAPRLAATEELLWLWDEEDVCLAVSPAAAASLGYTPDELVGRSYGHLQAQGQDWHARHAELYEKGRQEGVRLARHKNGQTVPVEYSARVVTIAGQRLQLRRWRLLASSAAAALLLYAGAAATAYYVAAVCAALTALGICPWCWA